MSGSSPAALRGANLKIIILGAGQVGTNVAESLVSEANDITVVDIDGARLRLLQDRLDLRTVTGSAAHPSVLKSAGIEDADMLIAVTQSDEINLVACKIAAHQYNVPTRIARIREDKAPAQATTLEELRALYERQFSVKGRAV